MRIRQKLFFHIHAFFMRWLGYLLVLQEARFDMKKAAVILMTGVLWLLALSGCSQAKGEGVAAAEAPPPMRVVADVDVTLFAVDHPEQYPLAEAVEHPTTSELMVTG